MISIQDHHSHFANMAAQTQGIQQLLTAEKRAAEKVNEARKRKARRLKQAKDEAQAEIQKYREVRASPPHNHTSFVCVCTGTRDAVQGL